jgi:hypothetical protein
MEMREPHYRGYQRFRIILRCCQDCRAFHRHQVSPQKRETSATPAASSWSCDLQHLIPVAGLYSSPGSAERNNERYHQHSSLNS